MEKNPTSSFKIGGILGKNQNPHRQQALFYAKKIFAHFAETSLIISSEIIKFARKIVLCKTFLIGKYSNFNFQNRGYFRKKKQKSSQVGGFFVETTSEAKCPEKPLANPEKPLANPEMPLANPEKPLADECKRLVYLTTTPLPYQPTRRVEMQLKA